MQIKIKQLKYIKKSSFNLDILKHKFFLKKIASLETPRVLAVKENELFFHESINQSLENFIRTERFLTFPEITSKFV